MGETNDTKSWVIRSTVWISDAKPDGQLRNLVCLVHLTDWLDALAYVAYVYNMFVCMEWSGVVDTCDRRARTKLWTDKGFETLISLYRSLANTLNGEMRSHWAKRAKGDGQKSSLRYRFRIYNFHFF